MNEKLKKIFLKTNFGKLILAHYRLQCKFYQNLKKMRYFNSAFIEFANRLSNERNFRCDLSDCAPRLTDALTASPFDRDYTYHISWAARRIAHIKPDFHTDFSSFHYLSCIISAFIPVKFYEYRPMDLHLSSLDTLHIDLSNINLKSESVPCASCLSVLEHIGLGRYGDILDPDGDMKAANEISRIISRGGSFLLNVPIGKYSHICFNAHRIYSIEHVLSMFNNFYLEDFLFIHTEPCKENTSSPTTEDLDPYINGKYASGCFHFIKK